MNFRRNLVPLVLSLVFLFAGVAPRLHAQGITTGTIIGQIVDPQGAVLPNAEITATNTATGITLHTTSLADGNFSFRAVPVGPYTVKVVAPGFTPGNIQNVQVESGVTTDLRAVALKIGSAETVEVNAGAATLLTPTESQVTTTFSTENMETLPLNNGFDTVTEVIPGVVSTHGDNFSNTNGDNFSVNGQSGRNNNFELDGQTNNDNSVAGPQIFFGNQDAIQEIQVITNDYSAQYGRNAGAVVNYITKSGTNSFHGTGFELYQGQYLSSMTNGDKSPLFGYCAPGQTPAADGCSAPVLPRYVENRYGGTLGGPILKNKLFFFGSTYWDRLRQGVSPSFSLPDLTPTPTGITQLQAAFPGNPAVAMLKAGGPYAIAQGNPQPIASSITTETVTGPGGVTAPIQFAGVSRSIPSLFNDEEDMGRLDWQPDSADHFFVRYFYQSQLSTGISGGSIAAGDFVNVPATNYSVGADWTHTFSPHWVDQLRYAFQESKVDFEGGALPSCTVNNLTSCTTDVFFAGTNLDLGLGINAAFPQGRTVKVTQVQDNATWSHGSHTVLFGGEYDYQNSPNVFLPLYNGELVYSDFSSFLQDSGLGELANGNPVIPFTEPDIAAYVQDDWKVSSHFTAHIGMRWEYFGQAVNELHNETVARESNPATAFWDPTLPLADRTVPAVNNVYKNFEPRIGFAWNPGFDSKMVVNAGYAINANPAFYNIFLIDAIASPVANTGVITCPCEPASGNPTGAGIRGADLPSLPTGPGVDPRFRDQTYVPTNFRTPYVQSWTLAVQHQIGHAAVGEVRYVGSKTTDNFQSVNANPNLAPVAAAFPTFPHPALCTNAAAPGVGRPSCNNANLALVTNGGWQDYNGLDLNLTTQNFHGLSGTLSYTWSRAIDNVTDVFASSSGAGSTTAFSQNPLDPNVGERGVDGNSFPNVVGAAFTYQMPKIIKSQGLMAKVVNGFTLTSLYRYNSGQPYNATQPLTLDAYTGDTSFCDNTFNASSVGSNVDTCRLALSNPKAPINTVAYLNPYTGPGGTTGTPQWVQYNSDGVDASGNYTPGTPTNPSANHWIVNNQAYALSVGNPYPGSGRNVLRGDPFSDLDMSLYKDFGITERVKMQLQFDAYNVLNQMFRGTGLTSVGNYVPGETSPAAQPFLSTAYNVESNAAGDSSGQRFFIFGGKLIF